MDKLNRKLQYGTKESLIGIVIVYKDKNNNNNQEEVLIDALDKYRRKHSLTLITSHEDIAKHMLNYFNSTLRPFDSKRVFKKIYNIYTVRKYVKQ